LSTSPTTAVAYRLLAAREYLVGATGQSLQNVDVGAIDDGALCFVLEYQAIYVLDKTSTEAVNAPYVIAANGGGRWYSYPRPLPDPIVWTQSTVWRAPRSGRMCLDGCGQGGCAAGGARPAAASSTAAGGGGGGGGGPATRAQRYVDIVKDTDYAITIGYDPASAGLGATTDGTSVGQGTSGADSIFTDGALVNERWQGAQAGRGGRWHATDDLRGWGGIELAGANLPSSSDANFISYYLLIPGLRMGGLGGRTGNPVAQAGTDGSSSTASARTTVATGGLAGTNNTGIAGSGGGGGATGPFGGIGGVGGKGGDGGATDGLPGSAGQDAPVTSYGAGGGGGGGGGNGSAKSGDGGNPGRGGPGVIFGYWIS
jgi:hypothetical protein